MVYLDNNATTRLAPEVLEAMRPYLTERWGNPSSAYLFGHELTQALETAREQVAALLNAEPREIIFTSCGTESINSALHSALVTQPGKRHVVTTAVEHSATLKFCAFLQKQGYEIASLGVSPAGALDLNLLEKSIRADTALVSVMSANNETGVLFPTAEIAQICSSKGVLCHTDAVQTVSKVKLNVKELGVDFLSISGHKFHAPKGVAALCVKRGAKFQPLIIGGGQERGRRGGTENVASIVGLGTAAGLALTNYSNQPSVSALRDKLEKGILESIRGTQVNGALEPRLPNTTNIAFEGVEAEGILLLLDQAGICASSGSACTTGSLDPSHVLLAMGCSAGHARSSIRFSLGIYNTEHDIEFTLQHLPGIIGKLRANAPAATPLIS